MRSSMTYYEHELRRLRQTLASNRLTERDHEANIDALWKENHELKVYLRALIHLLIGKKLLSGDEVAEMVRTIERSAEPEGRPAPAGDTSPELLALRRAVDESEGAAGDGQ
jgi:hypothetical protein